MYETRKMAIPFPCRLNGDYCEEKKGSYGPQFSEAYSEASHINSSIPRKEKDSGSFTLPCLMYASKMPLTVKYPKEIAENVLVRIGKFTFPVDFIILDMPEDIKVPLILERPFLSIVRAKINVYKRKLTLRAGEERIVFTSVKPANKDGVQRIMLIGIFNNVCAYMDAYRDEGMGDVILGEPFLREVGIKTKRFKGMITIYDGDDEVTYQMVRSRPRFKHHTNEQCNKISPLLKVSEEDKMNRILHSYQKLKGFYKGVLNLGPDYIRDAKTEEWLTHALH
ncbi:putative reverse transcriptase domain-containing protein [Tanacetum coccineum]